jgi:Outer membrane protein beta-barrel domain
MVSIRFIRQNIKFIAGLLLLLTVSFTTYGQTPARKADLIVKKDNTAIEAVINEIEETAVTYRRFSAPTGQLYRIEKAKLKYIRYGNGDIEKFDEPVVATSTAPTRPASTQQPTGAGRSSANTTTTQPTTSNPSQRPSTTAANTSSNNGRQSGSSSPSSSSSKPQTNSNQSNGTQGSVSSSIPRPRVSSSGQVGKPTAPSPDQVAGQIAKAGLKIGVLGGAGLSQITTKSGGKTASSDLVGEALGFRGGFLAELPIGPVAIAPTIEFAITKFALKNFVGTSTGVVTLNQAILSLPVIIPQNPDKKVQLYAGVGPYVAYNISGKTPSFDATGKLTTVDIKFSEAGSLQQIQAGAMARLGVRLSSFAVYAFGNYSLTSWTKPVTGATTTATTNALSFGLQLQASFGK